MYYCTIYIRVIAIFKISVPTTLQFTSPDLKNKQLINKDGTNQN